MITNSHRHRGGLDDVLIATTRWIVRLERLISVCMFVIIVITMGSQVFARYVLHRPFSWSEELSRFGLVWMAFLGAAFVMAEGNHICVDLWSGRASKKASQSLQLLAYFAVAVACFMLFVGGLKFVWYVRPVGSPTLGIPKSFWYASVSTGLLLMGLHSLANFVLVWRTGQPFRGEFAEHVEESFDAPRSTAERSHVSASEDPS